jgi:hypothetical protein
MIPAVIFVLMVNSCHTRGCEWRPGYFKDVVCPADDVTAPCDRPEHSGEVFFTMKDCIENAPPKGTVDAHNIPLKWKCVPYMRRP